MKKSGEIDGHLVHINYTRSPRLSGWSNPWHSFVSSYVWPALVQVRVGCSKWPLRGVDDGGDMWKLITGHRLPGRSHSFLCTIHVSCCVCRWPFVLHNNRPMPKSLVIYAGTTGYWLAFQKINISKGIVILCHKFSGHTEEDVVEQRIGMVERRYRDWPGNVSTIYSHNTVHEAHFHWGH